MLSSPKACEPVTPAQHNKNGSLALHSQQTCHLDEVQTSKLAGMVILQNAALLQHAAHTSNLQTQLQHKQQACNTHRKSTGPQQLELACLWTCTYAVELHSTSLQQAQAPKGLHFGSSLVLVGQVAPHNPAPHMPVTNVSHQSASVCHLRQDCVQHSHQSALSVTDRRLSGT